MKNKTPLFFLLFVYFLLLTNCLEAQKHFYLTAEFPPGIEVDKVEVWLKDVNGSKKIAPTSKKGNRLVFEGDYYSIYAVLNFRSITEPSCGSFSNEFFINDSPATITFLEADKKEYPFHNYKTKNILDFKDEKIKLNNYIQAERQIALDYERKHIDQIMGEHRDADVQSKSIQLVKAMRRKELEYVISNKASYYSFYTFREDITKYGIVSSDSLIAVFNSFSDEFRLTDEGNFINESLHLNRPDTKEPYAIDFTATDINRRKFKLSDFQGKQYVLLHFWATWCSPCMKELPEIRKVREEYHSDQLQIVSVALPSKVYADFKKTLKKFGMDWIHIYNDADLYNKLGNKHTPRICLVDKNGMVIYDSFRIPGYDIALVELNKILVKQLK
jgi:thiol-disulfide isomerase/thioredoxin